MTDNYVPMSVPSPGWEESSAVPGADPGPGTAEVARDQAADLAQGAVEAGKHAAGSTREQASSVAAEAVQQGRGLLDQAQGQLRDQAAAGQQRLASDLHALSEGFISMAAQGGQPGLAADLARQAAGAAGNVARWLDGREPGQVLEEVKSFARRRPGAFVALAAGAGLLAGRLTRGLSADSSDEETRVPAEAVPGLVPDSSMSQQATVGRAGDQTAPGLGADVQWDTTLDAASAAPGRVFTADEQTAVGGTGYSGPGGDPRVEGTT